MKPKSKKELNFKYIQIGSQIVMPMAAWRKIVIFLRKHGAMVAEITDQRKYPSREKR